MLHEKSGQIRKSTYNKLFHPLSTPYQHVIYTPTGLPGISLPHAWRS